MNQHTIGLSVCQLVCYALTVVCKCINPYCFQDNTMKLNTYFTIEAFVKIYSGYFVDEPTLIVCEITQ